jgi:triosephosphate isomerase
LRQPVIIGNWKMNTDIAGATALAHSLRRSLTDISDVEIGVCPPLCFLCPVAKVLEGSNIGVGAQNVHYESSGAFTGEVSAGMLASIPVRYVIVGHSERRQFFGETDETVNKKLRAAISADLTPIFCCGETLAERESGETEEVLRRQIDAGLSNLSAEEMARCIIAYEPVWAIGTGRTATPETASQSHRFIRELISQKFGAGVAGVVRIQYGGSVKPENIDSLMAQDQIDGALVGGASLVEASFERIVRFKNRSRL